MFAKFNLSRLSGLAALGILCAVLGGCAEGMPASGQASSPLGTNHELNINTRYERTGMRVASGGGAGSVDSLNDGRALDGHGRRFASNLH